MSEYFIELNLKELVACLTQSVGYCSLVNYPNLLEGFTQKHPFQFDEIYYIDGTDLYTIDGWKEELRRRKELTDASEKFQREYKPKTEVKSKSLIDRIIEAKESGNTEELKKLAEILKLMKESK